MTKILCETTGEFELVDFSQNQLLIRCDRPVVSGQSSFLSQRAAIGQVRILETLSDEATDEEFAKYVAEADGDIELAIDSFKTSFGINETSSKTEVKRRGPNKPKVEA